MGIYITADIDIKKIRKSLQKIEPEEQNKILKKALKEVAEQARKRLSDKAQETYVIRDAAWKREMKIKVATGNQPKAIIRAIGAPLKLKSFKVLSSSRATKVQVKKGGGLKPLEVGGIKAFVGNIANKNQTRKKDTKKGRAGTKVRHIAVAQREGKERLGIKEKFGNSIPVMLKHSYEKTEEYIGDDLKEKLEFFVQQALKG